jgi:hypothetical protein
VDCGGRVADLPDGVACVEQGPVWVVEYVHQNPWVSSLLGLSVVVLVVIAGVNYWRGVERDAVGSEVVWNGAFALGCLVGTSTVTSLLNLPYVADVVLGVGIAFVWAEIVTHSIPIEELEVLGQLE